MGTWEKNSRNIWNICVSVATACRPTEILPTGAYACSPTDASTITHLSAVSFPSPMPPQGHAAYCSIPHVPIQILTASASPPCKSRVCCRPHCKCGRTKVVEACVALCRWRSVRPHLSTHHPLRGARGSCTPRAVSRDRTGSSSGTYILICMIWAYLGSWKRKKVVCATCNWKWTQMDGWCGWREKECSQGGDFNSYIFPFIYDSYSYFSGSVISILYSWY